MVNTRRRKRKAEPTTPMLATRPAPKKKTPKRAAPPSKGRSTTRAPAAKAKAKPAPRARPKPKAKPAPRARPKPKAKAPAKRAPPKPKLTKDGALTLRALTGALEAPLTLQVLDVYRYKTDAVIRVMKDLQPAGDDDIHDVVLSDGAHKIKCVLSPALNKLVKTGRVFPMTVVRVTDAAARFDETALNEPAYVVIRALERVEGEATASHADYPAGVCERERQAIPRIGKRGYYISIWSDDEPAGDAWQTTGIDMDADFTLPNSHPTIQHIVDPRTRPAPLPPLVGRVMRKSRLVRFSSPAKALEQFPFNFEFAMADKSGAVTVVVWARACLKFFRQVNEGDVLMVEGYKVKHRFGRASEEWEVSVDTVNPVGKITRLTGALAKKLGVPDIKYEFRTTAQLSVMPDGTVFDFVGQVAAVDDVEREVLASGSGHAEFRWIYIRDQTSKAAVPVQLYANSMSEALRSVEALDVVLLTGLELHSVTKDSVSARDIRGRSTFHTHVYVGDTLPRTPETEAARKWARKDGRGGSIAALQRQLGPLRQHGKKRVTMLRDPTLESFRATFPKIPLVPISEVAVLGGGLGLHEKKDVLVQAFITRLEAAGEGQGEGGGVAVDATLVGLNREDSVDARLTVFPEGSVADALLEAFPSTFLPDSVRATLAASGAKKRRKGPKNEASMDDALAVISSATQTLRAVVALSIYRRSATELDTVVSMVFNPTV